MKSASEKLLPMSNANVCLTGKFLCIYFENKRLLLLTRKREGRKGRTMDGVKPLPQSCSSLPSRQSKILSHLRRSRMQPPSLQRNSLPGSHSLLRFGVQRGSDGSERTYRHIQEDSW